MFFCCYSCEIIYLCLRFLSWLCPCVQFPVSFCPTVVTFSNCACRFCLKRYFLKVSYRIGVFVLWWKRRGDLFLKGSVKLSEMMNTRGFSPSSFFSEEVCLPDEVLIAHTLSITHLREIQSYRSILLHLHNSSLASSNWTSLLVLVAMSNQTLLFASFLYRDRLVWRRWTLWMVMLVSLHDILRLLTFSAIHHGTTWHERVMNISVSCKTDGPLFMCFIVLTWEYRKGRL